LDLRDLAVIRTKPSNKKRGIRQKSDDLRRVLEIYTEVRQRVAAFRGCDVLAFEECPSLRSASVTRKVAMSWGTILGALYNHNEHMLVYEASPQTIKQTVAGKVNASKDAIIAEVDRSFTNARSFGIPDTMFAHAADAAAVALWVIREDAVQWRLRK
jgi:Holliday junction resolvasome RuvABC endonuclease subunit